MSAENVARVVPAEKPAQPKPADGNKVQLTRPADGSARPQRKRRKLLGASFLFAVVIPALLGAIYFTSIASDRYVSDAGFAVRGVDSAGGIDGIGALTGLASSGSTTSDSYIILRYLESRELLKLLQEDLDLRAAFSAPEVDALSRLDPAASIEDFVAYWGTMIDASFDSTSGIVTFEVEAYTREQAEEIARRVLGHTRDLVNDLSESARSDSVRFAEAEVERAEERLRAALADIRAFREDERSLNPAVSAELDMQLVNNLQAQLIDVRARMDAISDSVDADAPSMMNLRRRADALEQQIADRTSGISRQQVAGADVAGLSDQLATYEALEVEKNFAQQAYASALTSLENARMEADRQQRYLAVYSYPDLPQEAIYPRRMLNILILTVVLFAAWGIGSLLTYSVRDHMA